MIRFGQMMLNYEDSMVPQPGPTGLDQSVSSHLEHMLSSVQAQTVLDHQL